MDRSVITLVRIRLAKSREDIESARLLFEHGLFRAAVNRAYYAVFHLATAALLSLGEERSKHSGVQSAFGQFLVKSGVIEPEYYETLRFARKLREESDYRDDLVTLSKEEAETLLQDAERFVVRLEGYLAEVGALGDKESL